MSERLSPDNWGTASAAYAARAEYVTRPSAELLISWIDEELSFSLPGTTTLDNGAGSGVVTTSLRARFPNLPIMAADRSSGMLEKIKEKGLPNVGYETADAIDLKPFADDTFTHSLSTFMIQFASHPHQALREMYRVTKPGGMLGLCMWKHLCFDEPWQDTVRQFEPGYVYPHTWTPDWSDGERLSTYVQSAGFKDVRMKIIQPRWDFETPEECFKFYLESKNPEFMRGYQPWWDKGMEGVMRPIFEKLVREKYNGARDFDMEVFLIVAKK